VVVGVDGSPHSEAAVKWAMGYAALFDRPLTILSAAGALGPVESVGDPEAARHERRVCARQAADAALALVQRSAPGLEVTTVVPNGDARELLVELSQQASIVVVGTRGHGPVGSLLLGSVSVAVANRAHCPVAVVRPSAPGAAGMVVGVAAEDSDSDALQFATELARAVGTTLDAVHVGQVPKGAAASTLARWSRTAETVVVGSRGGLSNIGLIGSIGRAVVEHAHSTVVVVRD
jgi:nucleotide-binding universal stress UspA family protein